MAISLRGNIVTNGLILNLDAANRKSYPGSGTAWTDLSGQNNTATLTNGPTYSSDGGGGVVLDGVNDYVTIPNFLSIGTGFVGTIEIVTSCTGSLIFNERTSTAQGDGYFYTSPTLNLSVGADTRPDSPYAYILTSSIAGRLNQVNHYAASYTIPSVTGNIDCLFGINGKFESSSTAVVVAGGIQFKNLDIGRARNFTFGTNYASNGSIYIVRIYNRRLSQNEILQNYNALKSRFGLT